MRIRHSLATTVTALVLAAAVGACSGTTSKVGAGSTVKGTPEHGGTVTVAEPSGASPDDIFPLPPATNTNGYNINLTIGEWPFLVNVGDGASSAVNPQESLYSSLTWSDNDSVITIVLKPWKWSDGTPITARDFTFVYNLLKANYNDWEEYDPGLFPADVTKVTTPTTNTVVISLNRSYNPSFYTDDVLTFVPLLPQHAWDKTSLTGSVGNYDETTAGAKAVWNFLQKQGSDIATFTTNPLWQVVNGPWKLAQFQSDGYYSWVPNSNYSGPAKPALSKVIFTPFTTDAAEMDTLRSGTSLTVALVPLNDVGQISALKAEGYAVASVPTAGVAEIVPNLYNPVNGPLLRQLYIRQALQYLINRPQITSDAFHGYADPGNGPVPTTYGQQWDSPQEKAGGPYGYSPAKATALLTAHGWKVVPNGTDTCQQPGTGASDCGAGVAAGEKLQFQLLYASGSAYFDQQNAAIQTSEAQAGIHIVLKAEPFNTLVATTATCNAASHSGSVCNWQLQQFGYQPYEPDPSGAGIFNTDAVSNYGGYSSPEMDQLIDQTEYGSSPSAFYAYEDYAAEQLPWLWLPDPSFVVAYKNNLAGFIPSSPFDFLLNPEVWYYVKPAMTWYLIRRVGQSIAVVIGVMILTFILLHMEPGSVARSVLGLKATPARVAIFDSLYGLNKPLYQQFLIYIKQLFQGNLGISYQLQQPVSSLIAQRLPRDAILLGLSTLLALVIGVPTGIYQALKHNRPADDLLAGTWFTLYSTPDFMEALLLIALLCVGLHVLPPAFPGGVTSVSGLFANWQALILPVVVLSINSVAGFSQYVRSTALQALAEDYIRVARAKGLPERLVLTRHVLRNSLLPVITILGLSLPDIVAGAVIVESIFNFPGMGLLFWQSALAHDFPVMLGGTLIIGVATVVGNLAADVAYSMLDPRIRYV